MVDWKIYIDSPQKRALDACWGSLTGGNGRGEGYGWGYGYDDGRGAGGGYGNSHGGGFGSDYDPSDFVQLADGPTGDGRIFGYSRRGGDGISDTEW